MIDGILSFLLDRLNKALPRDFAGDPKEELFCYVGTDKDDAVNFKSDAVSMLLLRIEEDTALGPPDRYARPSSDGNRQKVEPEIRMNLWILFAARFSEYVQALRHLSRVVRYFQNHRVFNQENSPDLKDPLQKVIVELVTPSLSEQNDIWAMLRVAYLPSALYKVRLVVFQDEDAQTLAATEELIHRISQRQPS
ncbi:MAG: DUF4255 domain-containing protein [Aestuariivirga sp.]